MKNVDRRAIQGCSSRPEPGRLRRDLICGSAPAAVGGPAADRVLVEALREVQPLEHELDGRRDPGRRLPDLEVERASRAARARRRGAWRTPTAAMSSPVCTTRPCSNAATTSVSFSGRVRARNVSRIAAFTMRSRICSSRPSSTVSNSTLPAVLATSASRSLTRGHHLVLAVAQRAAGGVGDERLVVGDRQAHRHAGALVDVRRAAGLLAHLGDDLGHEVGHVHVEAVGGERTGLLLDDRRPRARRRAGSACGSARRSGP